MQNSIHIYLYIYIYTHQQNRPHGCGGHDFFEAHHQLSKLCKARGDTSCLHPGGRRELFAAWATKAHDSIRLVTETMIVEGSCGKALHINSREPTKMRALVVGDIRMQNRGRRKALEP